MGKLKAFTCGAVIGFAGTLFWFSDLKEDLCLLLGEKIEAAVDDSYGSRNLSEEELKEKIEEARQRIAARMEENAKTEVKVTD